MGSSGRGLPSFARALRKRVVLWPAVALALAAPLAATSLFLLAGAKADAPQQGAGVHQPPEAEAAGEMEGSVAAGSRVHRVAAKDDVFEPQRMVIAPGDTVVWTNEGSSPHTVTADDGAFDSGEIAPGESFKRTFGKKGVYFYFCAYHGAGGRIGMWGVVIVAEKEDTELIDAGSTGPGHVAPATGSVTVGDDFFSPQKLQIRPGDSVVWGSAGSRPHTVSSDEGAFDSGTLSPGATFSHTFTKEGTYFYYCRFHGGPRSGMWGVIVVSRSAEPVMVPGGAGGGDSKVSVPPGSAVHRVAAADGDVFSPTRLTIGAGDTVIWTNRDASAHTVTSDTRAFRSGSLSPGARFSRTFTRAGTFYYYCEFHGSSRQGMWGVIFVLARGAVPGTGPPPPAVPDDDNSGHGNTEDDPNEELAEARRRCNEEMAEAKADGDPDKIEQAREKCEEWFADAEDR